MSRGEAYRHIRLLDATGKPVAAPFLELDEELWSDDGKRFTLLFDPGRIKRGLKPREELGPVLEAGKSYELVDRPRLDRRGGQSTQGGIPQDVPHRARRRDLAGPEDLDRPPPRGRMTRSPWRSASPSRSTAPCSIA